MTIAVQCHPMWASSSLIFPQGSLFVCTYNDNKCIAIVIVIFKWVGMGIYALLLFNLVAHTIHE